MLLLRNSDFLEQKKTERMERFDIRDLELLWSLIFGAWSFYSSFALAFFFAFFGGSFRIGKLSDSVRAVFK